MWFSIWRKSKNWRWGRKVLSELSNKNTDDDSVSFGYLNEKGGWDPEKVCCGWKRICKWMHAIYQSVYKCTSLENHSFESQEFITYTICLLHLNSSYNCGWHFTVLSLHSVMLKGIWFLFLGNSIASLSVHHTTASNIHLEIMHKSYLKMFPVPHLKKTVLKLSNLPYSNLHGFCFCALALSARWQQSQLQRDFMKILPISKSIP